MNPLLLAPPAVTDLLTTHAQYNAAVWPAQLLLLMLALAAVLTAMRGYSRSSLIGIAFLWLWSGVVFFVAFFSRTTPAAYLFAAMFVAQACVIFYYAMTGRLRFQPRGGVVPLIGAFVAGYALIGYPIAGWLAGDIYPATPTFGAPCPVTMFTVGMLLWMTERIPGPLTVAPILWSVAGTYAAIEWQVMQDFMLPISAVAIMIALIVYRFQKVSPEDLPFDSNGKDTYVLAHGDWFGNGT